MIIGAHLGSRISIPVLAIYTGWARKNATLTINNLKKTRDRIKVFIN